MRERLGRYQAAAVALVVGAGLLAAAPGAARAQDEGQQSGDRSGGLPAGSQMLRGTVTASAADGLTMKTGTGEIYKVTVTPNTRLTKDRQPVKLAEIKVGDGVGAMGVLDAPTKTLHALFVGLIDAEQVRKAQADLGKTYIAGEVTAIDDVKLTIKRPDGVLQTITVDEGTSFRKGGRGMGGGRQGGGRSSERRASAQRAPQRGEGSGGESVTLADLKVGDGVMGRGAIKNGVFVPTELRVMDAAARQRRRNEANGAPDGGAGPATAGSPAPQPGVQ